MHKRSWTVWKEPLKTSKKRWRRYGNFGSKNLGEQKMAFFSEEISQMSTSIEEDQAEIHKFTQQLNSEQANINEADDKVAEIKVRTWQQE